MQRDNWMKCRSSTRFRREGERVSGRSPESSSPAHHRLQDLPAEEILGRPCPRLHDLRWIQGQGGPACCVPGEDFIDNVVCWMNEWIKKCKFPHLLTDHVPASSSPRATLVVLCCARWDTTAGRCTAWWASARSAAPWRTNPAFSPAPPPTSPGSRQHASGTSSCTKLLWFTSWRPQTVF